MASPFAGRGLAPEHFRGGDGAIGAAEEVRYLRRQAAAEWIARHGVAVTVDELLRRADQVGADAAISEALARHAAAGS